MQVTDSSFLSIVYHKTECSASCNVCLVLGIYLQSKVFNCGWCKLELNFTFGSYWAYGDSHWFSVNKWERGNSAFLYFRIYRILLINISQARFWTGHKAKHNLPIYIKSYLEYDVLKSNIKLKLIVLVTSFWIIWIIYAQKSMENCDEAQLCSMQRKLLPE